jgi:hypothetical protein
MAQVSVAVVLLSLKPVWHSYASPYYVCRCVFYSFFKKVGNTSPSITLKKQNERCRVFQVC